MGVNNRQRRKAKKLQRDRRGGQARPGGSGAHPPHRCTDECLRQETAALVRQGVLVAAEAFRFEDELQFEREFTVLCQLRERVGYGAVDEAVTWWVDLALDRCWQEGWHPGDVDWVLTRRLGAEPGRAVAARVAASASKRPQATADVRWAAQIQGLQSQPEWAVGSSAVEWEKRLHAAVRAVSLLLYLPRLPDLGRSQRAGRCGGQAGAMLERVRALLAKAESTPFPEEAEAFSAKAQELMARHAIDEAMLHAAGGSGEASVIGWRIHVDDPYAGAKSSLLHHVAQANRCHSVYSADMGFSTVFGFEPDLEIVELLFTSLLVQASEAMMRAGRSVDRSGRSRTRSFRQSFLTAYAIRVGERLEAVAREVVAEGESRYGGALLPVLAGREKEVDDAVTGAFPRLVSREVRISNGAGWVAGRAAADVASLAVGEALSGAAVT